MEKTENVGQIVRLPDATRCVECGREIKAGTAIFIYELSHSTCYGHVIEKQPTICRAPVSWRRAACFVALSEDLKPVLDKDIRRGVPPRGDR